MQVGAGDRLGPYQVSDLIGRGGMGEVYRATDTRLNRPVAIKLCHLEFNDRFDREARSIASLNHPNICTLYDVGPNYLVMEFVDGELLSGLIENGPLPLDKAIFWATQIADALAAAHAKGIVHRDLKPGNIIVTVKGAKVLDFGLAKFAAESSSKSATSGETITAPITREGAILGTLNYMSPEQVEGKESDERSDIFACGVVLYEMLTGRRPFQGGTPAALLASILRDPVPPIGPLRSDVPRSLERIVRRCLEKNPADRWRSAQDLRSALELIDLEAVPASPVSASVPSAVTMPQRKGRKWIWPVAVLGTLVLVGGLGWKYWNKPAAPASAVRFQVTLPEGINFDEYLSLSPDGHKVLFLASGEKGGFWIRDLETLEWRHLEGTKGAAAPFWSPDSKYIAFSTVSELKKIEVSGGTPVTVTMAPNVGSGAWNKDDVIIFGGYGSGSIRRVSASGGTAVEVTALNRSRGETFHSLPVFLPDGKHFLYLRAGTIESRGIYVGSTETKPEQQSNERILPSQLAVPYANGKVFFLREKTLMAQAFDDKTFKLTGEPYTVAENIATSRSVAAFSVSSSGVLAYHQGAGQDSAFVTSWYDRTGNRISKVEEQLPDRGFSLSPDAKTAVGRDAETNGNGDLWLLDLMRGVRSRLTFMQSPGSPTGVWSPDGTRIYFSANNRDNVFEKLANGAGDARNLYQKPGQTLTPTSVSRDGRFLLLQTEDGTSDVLLLPLQGDVKPIPLLAEKYGERAAHFSSDDRWIAYTSSESGRTEIYVRPFAAEPTPSFGDGKWQVSKTGGVDSRWTKDNHEIVFRRGTALIAVDVTPTANAILLGPEKPLFDLKERLSWDVTADGQRFLITTLASDTVQTPITVVLNWEATLKK